MADEDVDLPAIGPVPKTWVWVGVGLVAVIAGWAWWRHRQDAASSVPVPDPATGSDTGSTGYVNPAPVDDTSPDAEPGPRTDAEWTRLVVNDLGLMYEASFVLDTLGKYLAGQQLTDEEIKLVRDAWAYRGRPPEHPGLNVVPVQKPTPGPPAPPPPPAPGHPPAPPPPPAPAPHPEPDHWHQVTIWPTRDSTISGLTAHYHPGLDWHVTWNDSHNAELRSKRGRPENIRPGDRVWVP